MLLKNCFIFLLVILFSLQLIYHVPENLSSQKRKKIQIFVRGNTLSFKKKALAIRAENKLFFSVFFSNSFRCFTYFLSPHFLLCDRVETSPLLSESFERCVFTVIFLDVILPQEFFVMIQRHVFYCIGDIVLDVPTIQSQSDVHPEQAV